MAYDLYWKCVIIFISLSTGKEIDLYNLKEEIPKTLKIFIDHHFCTFIRAYHGVLNKSNIIIDNHLHSILFKFHNSTGTKCDEILSA